LIVSSGSVSARRTSSTKPLGLVDDGQLDSMDATHGAS
jgi:hypothetical protein